MFFSPVHINPLFHVEIAGEITLFAPPLRPSEDSDAGLTQLHVIT